LRAGRWGPQGARGPAGPPGPDLGFYEEEQSSAMNASDSKLVIAACPQGTFAVGGGYEVVDNTFPPAVPVVALQNTSWLAAGGVGEGWTVHAVERAATDTPWKLTTWVMCAG